MAVPHLSDASDPGPGGPTSAPTPPERRVPPTLGRTPSFDELGTPLIATTFVVLDLETTGLSPEHDRITEIGAVKVRGGEVLGELATLVHPGRPLPAAITAITGITDAMLAQAPRTAAVLPTLRDFLGDAVLVAHNASFDVSFLRAAFARERDETFAPVVVDTARLARRLLDADDGVRDRRLATLARFFGSRTVPDHRALTDARATVDVLHGLLERAGSHGATTLEDLRDLTRSRSTRAYRRVGLVADAPRAPGTYRFLDARDEVLYVGKATDLRARLRTYFGQDPRRKVGAMLRETARVTWEPAATLLEAEVREVRDIATHQPRFNRRSRGPSRAVHVALTAERFPRLSLVRSPGPSHRRTLGPFPSRTGAQAVVEALERALPVRTCTGRLRVAQDHPACALKDLGRCGAPCDGTQSAAGYAEVVATVEAALEDPSAALATLEARMRAAAADGRFERAAELRTLRHRAATALVALRERATLVSAGRLVLARPDAGHLEVVAAHDGRVVTSRRVPLPSGTPPGAGALASWAAEHAPPPTLLPPPTGPNDLEEVALLAAWSRRPGVVLVAAEGTFAGWAPGGAALAAAAAESRRTARRLREDRRVLDRRKVVARAG